MAMTETRVSDGNCEIYEHLAFTTEKAIGFRARIGVVVLATDYTVEHEFRKIISMPGVDVYQARIRNNPTITPRTLAAMGPLITETAELILPGDDLDVLAYGCTSASTILGESVVHECLKAAKPMAKTTNPVSAAFAAFDALGASRIAVLTPYRRDVNDIVRDYIRKRGYEVPVFGSFNEEHDPTAAAIDGDSLRRAVQTITEGRQVDAVFVSCTSIRLAGAVAEIEAETGMPTTSSNHAMAWHCLRLAGVDDRLTGMGRLFECAL